VDVLANKKPARHWGDKTAVNKRDKAGYIW